jgi:hypothetical protein
MPGVNITSAEAMMINSNECNAVRDRWELSLVDSRWTIARAMSKAAYMLRQPRRKTMGPGPHRPTAKNRLTRPHSSDGHRSSFGT